MTPQAADKDVPPLRTRCFTCGPAKRWFRAHTTQTSLLDEVQRTA
jgi:hypothetical protein